MGVSNVVTQPDKPAALFTLVGVLALSLFLQHEVHTRQALLFLIGTALGITLLHAAFGFAGGWRRLIREHRGAAVRAQLMLLALTSALFFPLLGDPLPGLGLTAAVAPVGVSVLVGAFLFGIGMQLGGACGSGTLFTVGSGRVPMLVTLMFFIVGATVGSAHLHWWLALPDLGERSLIGGLGWGRALLLQVGVLGALYGLIATVERRRHQTVEGLVQSNSTAPPFVDRLIAGPWPLWWAVIGLSMLNLMTLLVAGHPWSITFAFGLWGAKIWAAVGGDVAAWPYWSSGYPSIALARSVLSDDTSVMNFGIVLGALLAAALAGRVAPEERTAPSRLLAAVAGGLLLGYGARLAFGCNIGALVAGIASGSLHGWLWLIAGFGGAWVGVQLRAYLRLDTPLKARS